LDKIEEQDFDVLAARPKVGKIERVALLVGALLRRSFQKSQRAAA
jgi:hypothetical protein